MGFYLGLVSMPFSLQKRTNVILLTLIPFYSANLKFSVTEIATSYHSPMLW